MVTWGLSSYTKISLFPFPSLYESQVCDNSPKYQVFHEHNFVIKVPKDHFLYSFQIMEATLQSRIALLSFNRKSCLEILRKVIKRTSQVSEPTIHIRSIFSFALTSLPHFSPIILLWVLLRSDDQLSMATWKPS